jgi:hypothetical protein
VAVILELRKPGVGKTVGFHEGRGAGKSTTPGGHIIVSRKEIVIDRQRKLREKIVMGEEKVM